jgi:hypothetical protein
MPVTVSMSLFIYMCMHFCVHICGDACVCPYPCSRACSHLSSRYCLCVVWHAYSTNNFQHRAWTRTRTWIWSWSLTRTRYFIPNQIQFAASVMHVDISWAHPKFLNPHSKQVLPLFPIGWFFTPLVRYWSAFTFCFTNTNNIKCQSTIYYPHHEGALMKEKVWPTLRMWNVKFRTFIYIHDRSGKFECIWY